MANPTVQQLYQDLQDVLVLEALTPIPDEPVVIAAQDVHRPGMAVMGFTKDFLPERIQIMGESEMSYLATLDAAGQVEAIERVLSLQPPTIVVTWVTPSWAARYSSAASRRCAVSSICVPSGK